LTKCFSTLKKQTNIQISQKKTTNNVLETAQCGHHLQTIHCNRSFKQDNKTVILILDFDRIKKINLKDKK